MSITERPTSQEAAPSPAPRNHPWRGPVIAGIGALVLVLAALVRFYALPTLSVAPADENTMTHLEASNATVLDTSNLSDIKDVVTNITITAHTIGDPVASKAAPGNTVVWHNNTTTADASGALSQSQQSAAFDARSGVAVQCCHSYTEATAGKKVPTRFAGQVYKFPFGSHKQTYDVWDNTLLAAVPAKYVGSSKIQGLTMYLYRAGVAPTKIGTQALPGYVLGMKGASSVTADSMYQSTTTYYVDPATGGIFNQVENLKQWFQSGTHQVVATQAHIHYTPAEISTMVHKYKSQISMLKVAGGWVPWALMVLGLVLVGSGVMQARGRSGQARRRQTA